jgi:nitrite reductase/ring-hydroxylating ferredoxin subunit
MNASLAKGKVEGKDIVCAFHAAKFNIGTDALINPAIMSSLPLDQFRQQIRSYYERIGPLMMGIKTYNQKTFGLKIDGDKILVGM